MAKYNATEIYDAVLISKLAFIGELISFMTVIFTIILLIIIIKRTPKAMKRFKFYIIQYMSFALLFEFMGIFCPITILHPLFLVSPNVHLSYTPSAKMFAMYATGLYFGMCMLDCSVGIIYERYYILSATNNSPSTKPFYIHGSLLAMNSICLIIGYIVLFIPSVLYTFVLTPEETILFVNNEIEGLDTKLAIETIIIFRATSKNSLPWPLIMVIFYGLFRVALALNGLYLNMKQSRSMHSQISLSPQVQKANDMLQRIIYIQFIGYFFTLILPLSAEFYFFYFIQTPSNIPTICSRFLIGYGLYDTVFTTLFIKPYREALFYPFKWLKENMASSRTEVSSMQN